MVFGCFPSPSPRETETAEAVVFPISISLWPPRDNFCRLPNHYAPAKMSTRQLVRFTRSNVETLNIHLKYGIQSRPRIIQRHRNSKCNGLDFTSLCVALCTLYSMLCTAFDATHLLGHQIKAQRSSMQRGPFHVIRCGTYLGPHWQKPVLTTWGSQQTALDFLHSFNWNPTAPPRPSALASPTPLVSVLPDAVADTLSPLTKESATEFEKACASAGCGSTRISNHAIRIGQLAYSMCPFPSICLTYKYTGKCMTSRAVEQPQPLEHLN